MRMKYEMLIFWRILYFVLITLIINAITVKNSLKAKKTVLPADL